MREGGFESFVQELGYLAIKYVHLQEVMREAKGLLEALDMEGENSQEVFTWSNGLREAIRKAEEK